MKTLTTFLIFFFTFSYSQTETKKIIKAISEASAQELGSLIVIKDKQVNVHKYVKKISKQTAAIVVLERKHLESLKKVDKVIKELYIYKEIKTLSEQIYDYNKKAYEFGKEEPLIVTYVSDVQISIIEDVVFLLDDLRLVLKGDKNLLDTVDRLEILEMIRKRLIKIRNVSKDHYNSIRLLINSNKFIRRKELFSIDFNKIESVITNEYDKYLEIIKE